jgi:hypothetical protein
MYEGKDGDDSDADENVEPSQADDGSKQNLKDSGQSRFVLGTRYVGGYEGEDGEDTDEEDKSSQADAGSTQNVEECRHRMREFDDCTVYFRGVQYD